MSKKTGQSKLSRCFKAPFKALCRARDFYIRSMNGCAGNYGRAMAGAPRYNLPRSFSAASSRSNESEDLSELIRAASTRTLGNNLDRDLHKQQLRRSATESNGVPRSFTVTIGRIDEDKPCDFGESIDLKTDLMYPRSRSYAVTKRTGFFSA